MVMLLVSAIIRLSGRGARGLPIAGGTNNKNNNHTNTNNNNTNTNTDTNTNTKNNSNIRLTSCKFGSARVEPRETRDAYFVRVGLGSIDLTSTWFSISGSGAAYQLHNTETHHKSYFSIVFI